MATNPKIDSKPVVENKAAPAPSGKSHKLWILIGSALLILTVGIGAFFAIPYYKTVKASAQGKGEAAVSGKESKSSRPPVKGVLALDPFLVNLADTEEIRFLKTTFQLGLEEDLGEEGKDPSAVAAIRDSIITLLSSKTADQILTPQGKDKLREEIRERVNAVSPQIKVVEVYIVDFVVQL
jgi:flagellar protein FliL